MASLKSRVTDGIRTRDIRNHNPPLKKWLRALRSLCRASACAEKRCRSCVGAPGADSSEDIMAALGGVVSGRAP